MKKLNAFTLAEVLITLTIIGVIAALTIPNLMQKWSDHADVQKVKEAYSIFDNAFKMAIKEEGAPLSDWSWPNTNLWQYKVNGNYLAEKLMPYLRVKTYCGSDCSIQHCYSFKPSGYTWKYYKNLNGTTGIIVNNSDLELGGRMMLENGMAVAFRVVFPRTSAVWGAGKIKNYIGSVVVDINGQKGPNQFGFDVFYLPFGSNGMMISHEIVTSTYADENFHDHRKINCRNKSSNGESCGTWIMLHGNMDYKYRDISTEW